MDSAISAGSISASEPYLVGIGSALTANLALSLKLSVIGVRTFPGATALTRTPFAAHEEEILRTHLASAYFVAIYIDCPTV